jgi:hypothetical protein
MLGAMATMHLLLTWAAGATILLLSIILLARAVVVWLRERAATDRARRAARLARAARPDRP